MIIIKIQVGLGNQMFQYAYGKIITKNKIKLKLDNTWYNYNKKVKRKYRLNIFDNKINLANEKDIKLFKPFFKNKIFEKIYHILKINTNIYQKHIIENKTHNKIIIKEGFWTNKLDLEKNEKYIQKIFKFKKKFIQKNKLKYKINTKNSISIHVRRTDYKNKNNDFIILDIKYYKKAIEHIFKKINDPIFFIFSDDIKWCEKNLNFINNKYYIKSKKDYEDLYLMSKCKHNIIANSTFSWWAAYLNNNKNKIIITPKVWTNKKKDLNINKKK